MMASVIKRCLIAVLCCTATIFVQQCLSQGTVQDNFLLVAGRPNLYQIDLGSGAIISLLATPRAGLVAVAYDPVEMVVYWTDVQEGLIGKDRLNGSRQYSTIIFQDPMGSVPLDGLELDIENRKLYYADAGDYNPKIVEMNLDGSRPVTIVSGAGMKPRALVLDTEKRDLYYTDWGVQPGIYVIDLSTRQNTTILTYNLTWPNALAIDFSERVMYWADAFLHRVEMANLDGSGRVMLVSDPSAHYYAMALGPQYLYITDWNHTAVKRLDRKTYTVSEQMPNVTGKLFGIVYYNSSFARGTKTPRGGLALEPENYESKTLNDMSLLVGVCVGVGGSVLILVIIIVVAVKISINKKRAKTVASNDSQSLPVDTTDYSTIVRRDVRSIYDVIGDNVGTESRYEGLQPYERGYDRLYSSEDHASNQPGREVHNTEMSGGVYQSDIRQHGMENLGYTTLNQEREERSYEQLQDPYRQGYEHLQPRDGETPRYTGLRRTEPGDIGYEQLQRNAGTNPQVMSTTNPPYEALNIGSSPSGDGNV